MADRELPSDGVQQVIDAVQDYSGATSYTAGWGSEDAKSRMSFEDNAIKISNDAPLAQNYLLQWMGISAMKLTKGRSYKVAIVMKATGDGYMASKLGDWGSGVEKRIDFTGSNDWQTLELTYNDAVTEDGSFLLLQSGSFVGDIWIRSITVSHEEAAMVEIATEKDTKTYTDGDFPYYQMGCAPPIVNGAIHFVPTGDWSQFFVWTASEFTMPSGTVFVDLELNSTKAGGGVQLTIQNGWGSDAQQLTSSINLVEGKQTVRCKFSEVEGGKYDVILKPQTFAGTIDLSKITLYSVVSGNTMPLTAQEKKDTLIWAMNNWIAGMMEATNGYVKAWDVVNEAIGGGGDDGEGNYALQHADTLTTMV